MPFFSPWRSPTVQEGSDSSRDAGEKLPPLWLGVRCSGKVEQDGEAWCSPLSSQQARPCTKEGDHAEASQGGGEGEQLASPLCPGSSPTGLEVPAKGVTTVKAGFLMSSRVSVLHQRIAHR